MKKQIRRGVFETNSSSVHSITMCTDKEYTDWCSGAMLIQDERFITKEDAIKELQTETLYKSNELMYADTDWKNEKEVDKLLKSCAYYTTEQYWGSIDFETFRDSYKTPSGEVIHAFGYYGIDN
jgi:hypothetical protein